MMKVGIATGRSGGGHDETRYLVLSGFPFVFYGMPPGALRCRPSEGEALVIRISSIELSADGQAVGGIWIYEG